MDGWRSPSLLPTHKSEIRNQKIRTDEEKDLIAYHGSLLFFFYKKETLVLA